MGEFCYISIFRLAPFELELPLLRFEWQWKFPYIQLELCFSMWVRVPLSFVDVALTLAPLASIFHPLQLSRYLRHPFLVSFNYI